MWTEWETHTEVCTAWTDWAGADADPKWEPCIKPVKPGERHCAEHGHGLARQRLRPDGARQRLSDGPPRQHRQPRSPASQARPQDPQILNAQL